MVVEIPSSKANDTNSTGSSTFHKSSIFLLIRSYEDARNVLTNLVKVFSGELVKIDFLADVSVALHFFKKFTNHPTACF